MTTIQESCKHQPIYFAPVNINVDEKTIGTVDVWRRGVCKKTFCEEKQLGIEAIADIVGMPKINSDEKWAVSICALQKGKDKWKLIKLQENSEIKHECLGDKIIPLSVENFAIKDDHHSSFLIEDHYNRAVEI